MKKIILILAVLLAGCTSSAFPGNEIMCDQNGRLFSHYAGSSTTSASGLDNKRQVCLNQPDGSILIKYPEKDHD